MPPQRLSTLRVLTFLTVFASSVTALCYQPDGGLEKNVEYVPCSNDTSNPMHTICCATNRTPERGPDMCAPNGLCQVGRKAGEPEKAPHYTKPQCTNKDWNEPGCLNVCGDDNLEWVTPCDASAGNASTKWCCGFENTKCCLDETSEELEILAINFGEMAQASTSSSTSSTPSPTPTPSSSSTTSTTSTTSSSGTTSSNTPTSTNADSTPPPPSEEGSSLSSGAKAGIGIGASLGGLLVFSGAFFLFRRRQSHQQRLGSSYDAGGYPIGAVTYAHENVVRYELPVTEKRSELEGERDPKEVP